MRHGHGRPRQLYEYEAFPFLWRIQDAMKFAIERYVSGHRARELGRVLFNAPFHPTPVNASTHVRCAFEERRGRSSASGAIVPLCA